MPPTRPKTKQPADPVAPVDPSVEIEEAPVYRYEYVGTQPTVFPSLTGLGIGEVHPGEELELPDPIVHAELVPGDKATRDATAQLLEWVAALEAEANGTTVAAVDEVDMPAASTTVEDPDPDAAVTTDPDPGAGDDANSAEEH
jgi:hypothetical protein